jgi:hypothetical protein
MKITKGLLTKIVKEEVKKQINQGRRIDEIFGLFGGGKKEKAKPSAGASKGNDTQTLQSIVKVSDKKKFAEMFKKNPRSYLSAVTLAANGVPRNFRYKLQIRKEYLPYIQTLVKRLEATKSGKSKKDPLAFLSVRFLTDESEANNRSAGEAFEVDSGNLSKFGVEAEKFVRYMKDYMKSEMDPSLKQLAKNMANKR